jgi:hypothetical protein
MVFFSKIEKLVKFTQKKKKSSILFFPNIVVEKTTIFFEKNKIIFVIVLKIGTLSFFLFKLIMSLWPPLL